MLWGGFRGDSLRVLRLCDFFLRQRPEIGSGNEPPVTLGLLVDEGKTNKFGVVTHIEILRHEFVGMCAHGAAALQIFLRRLQLGGFPGDWPDFSSREAWYSIPFSPGNKPGEAVSWQASFDHLELL